MLPTYFFLCFLSPNGISVDLLTVPHKVKAWEIIAVKLWRYFDPDLYWSNVRLRVRLTKKNWGIPLRVYAISQSVCCNVGVCTNGCNQGRLSLSC